MMESHNNKKPTKKQAQQQSIQKIIDTYTISLKDNYIKNIMMGFESASQMYLDKIEEGCDMEELKDFIKKNIAHEELIEKVAKGEKKIED